nr:AcvB/VirJ family lysyl-phosphatidylglycerol hydrolase [Pararhodospirillum photometricum]
MLVGYSFGADVLPATFAALSEADRARVVRLSLLALSPVGDFEISLSGWMGRRPPQGIPTLPDLEGVAPGMIQCAYGEDEAAESACPALEQRGADVLRTTGGHHFDGDYGRLARWILKGI